MSSLSSEKPNILLPDDGQLWSMLIKSDTNGLEGLYIRYAEELFKLGMSIRANRSLVHDCIQDVFVDIWQYRNSIKAAEDVKRYLIKCLRNKIHNEVKKDKKWYLDQEHINLGNHLLIDLPSQTKGEVDEEKVRKVKKAILQLPARKREVIRYLFLESLGYEDVSQIMGINIQSVYTLAWKALRQLRKSLKVGVVFWCFLNGWH